MSRWADDLDKIIANQGLVIDVQDVEAVLAEMGKELEPCGSINGQVQGGPNPINGEFANGGALVIGCSFWPLWVWVPVVSSLMHL